MTLWPFKNKSTQKLFSIISLIAGVILMLSVPIIKIYGDVQISGFALGAIIGFLGLLYFFDSQ